MEEQLNLLIQENDELKKKVESLEEENRCLWDMLDELKESEKSIGTTLKKALEEHLEEEYFKSLKTVGDA
jgi:regulator of replication initiation timing